MRAVDGVFDTADDVTYQAMSLELGRNAHGTATDIEVFVGVGGDLDDKGTGGYADDTINKDGGIGIYATLEELTLVTLKNNNDTPSVLTDDTSYMGLRLDGLEAELVGIDGLTFGIFDGVVLVNTANDTDGDANTTAVKLDWTTFGTGKRGMTVPLLTDVDADIDLHIEGSVALDAFGVLIAKGSFSSDALAR